jgi:4-hydroxybenzoate polyprenyltransferase
MDAVVSFVKSLRVRQWVKNVFIFAPMIFSMNFRQLEYVKNSTIAFILFSLITGTIYIFNDCIDRKYDRFHPKKKYRPIASGRLRVGHALAGALGVMAVALFLIFRLNRTFFLIAVIYIVLNILYSFYLKKIVILDVMIIAIGFVMRILIGGVINNIELSTWILIVTFLLSIFLGLIKRRQELVKLNAVDQQAETGQTRRTLKKYNLSLLDQLISITTATTLISYIMYVVNPDIQSKFHTRNLFLTIPFVVFGIFRYLYLTYTKDKGESPEEIIFSDLPFSLNIVLWVIVFVFLIYQ